jgi:hypothetical protein
MMPAFVGSSDGWTSKVGSNNTSGSYAATEELQHTGDDIVCRRAGDTILASRDLDILERWGRYA